MVASSSQTSAITYPDSDGQPMADNTLQFEWIVVIKENLELLFAEDPQVFVAGDLLWYPLEGNNTLRRAPDAMVVFGCPKGYRGSYQQWLEGNIAPQVVFEILSPSNRLGEMAQKFAFYQTYGVEEYYIYDPHVQDFSGWLRRDGLLAPIEGIENWVSPRLQIRFELLSDSLKLWRPDGQPFLTFGELDQLRRQAELAAERARLDAQQAKLEAQQARVEVESATIRAISAEERAEKLAAYLRSLGVNPEEI